MNVMVNESTTLREWLEAHRDEVKKYESCMSLFVNEDGLCVELLLDTSRSTYSTHIEGEGGDICLIRDNETNEVVGCRLPLMNRKLAVFHNGELNINEGFKKRDGT